MQTGAIANRYDYTPFGKLSLDNETIANPFKFSSEYHDEQTGLIYYNPSNAKWLNRDPIQEDGGKNIYGFVYGDSINYFDNCGLGLWDWIMTDNWNPSQAERDAAYRGWADRYRSNLFTFTDPEATRLSEIYTDNEEPTAKNGMPQWMERENNNVVGKNA